MKFSILALILLLIVNSSTKAQDSSKTNCLERLERKAKFDQKISILKKDQKKLSGYFRGVKDRKLLFSKTKHDVFLDIEYVSIELSEIDKLTLINSESRLSIRRVANSFMIGLFVGGSAAIIFELTDNNGAAGEHLDAATIVSTSLITGLVSTVLFGISSIEQTEKLIIYCE